MNPLSIAVGAILAWFTLKPQEKTPDARRAELPGATRERMRLSGPVRESERN